MYDFEKLGAFYLGKRVDADSGELTDDLVLYDSKDLTTHALISGMTGSGKTGLGIGVLGEAGDVARARQTAEKIRADLAGLSAAFEREVEALDTAYDAQTEELKEIPIRPKATDIHVSLLGLAWMPIRDPGDGRLQSAWD